jgi:hypothetical protein
MLHKPVKLRHVHRDNFEDYWLQDYRSLKQNACKQAQESAQRHHHISHFKHKPFLRKPSFQALLLQLRTPGLCTLKKLTSERKIPFHDRRMLT